MLTNTMLLAAAGAGILIGVGIGFEVAFWGVALTIKTKPEILVKSLAKAHSIAKIRLLLTDVEASR